MSYEPSWTQDYYPTSLETRSYNGDVEYIDEIIEEEHFEYPSQRRRASFREATEDKRPKCQPIGAQIDCRLREDSSVFKFISC